MTECRSSGTLFLLLVGRPLIVLTSPSELISLSPSTSVDCVYQKVLELHSNSVSSSRTLQNGLPHNGQNTACRSCAYTGQFYPSGLHADNFVSPLGILPHPKESEKTVFLCSFSYTWHRRSSERCKNYPQLFDDRAKSR